MPKHSVLALLAVAALASTSLPAQTIASKTTSMKHIDGYLPLDWDAKAGKLYLEIPHFDSDGQSPDILYTHSLPYGTGSNDLGLDRGQISEGIIVRFQRSGPKILLVQPNEAFRSSSTDSAEQLVVRQSFPESVLFGFKVEAEDPSGAVLVDATDFYLRDAHGVAEKLSQLKQGTFKLDDSRSTIAPDATRASLAIPRSRRSSPSPPTTLPRVSSSTTSPPTLTPSPFASASPSSSFLARASHRAASIPAPATSSPHGATTPPH
jgi:hypothetical protein